MTRLILRTARWEEAETGNGRIVFQYEATNGDDTVASFQVSLPATDSLRMPKLEAEARKRVDEICKMLRSDLQQ